MNSENVFKKSDAGVSVLIVAAETSSALYGLRLLEFWKKKNFKIQAFGVGDSAMESIGFERLGKSEEMAVMGLAEVLKHYSHIKSVFDKVVSEVERRKPAVAVLMDYPGFNLKLAEKLKQMGIPVVYYIAPQVWAWKQKRVFKIQKNCDKVLALFPFEVPFFKKFSVPVEFVGHPLLDELSPELYSYEKSRIERQRRGILDSEKVLGLMPGSRRMELELNFPTQLEVASKMLKKHSDLKVMILTAPNFEKEDLLPYLENFKWPFQIIKDEPFKMIQLVDFMLATSGTATLQVGLLEKPMVVMYKFKWLTAIIAKLIVKGTRFFGIVNLIFDREVVPERWQSGADADKLFPLLDRMMTDEEYFQAVKKDLAELRYQLGDVGATERVAHILESYIG